jgi:hypothetical protein
MVINHNILSSLMVKLAKIASVVFGASVLMLISTPSSLARPPVPDCVTAQLNDSRPTEYLIVTNNCKYTVGNVLDT